MRQKDKRDILFVAIWVILIALACCSCRSTKYVEVPKYHTDTTYITKTEYDSIWKHDSIYLHEYQRGETLYVEKEKWHTLYQEKKVTDTLYRFLTDSVPVPYPVEKQLTWGQQTAIKWFPWLLVAMIGLIGWTCRKPLSKLIRAIILRV